MNYKISNYLSCSTVIFFIITTLLQFLLLHYYASLKKKKNCCVINSHLPNLSLWMPVSKMCLCWLQPTVELCSCQFITLASHHSSSDALDESVVNTRWLGVEPKINVESNFPADDALHTRSLTKWWLWDPRREYRWVFWTGWSPRHYDRPTDRSIACKKPAQGFTHA